MDEQFVTLHCEPCDSCRSEAWQHVVDGRLRWEDQFYCTAIGLQSCDGGWEPAPPWIREVIVAREGTVHLAVGGPDGAPLKAVREVLGLTLPELRRARADGIDVTPAEAAVLGPGAAGAEGSVPGR
ncbi:hypothetical protein [Streptomyces sp. NPDC058401]|uniref:hypothetical protein n=1 Tax=Streptomyces sp. NPDC058401 TaxID=3346480 RepID=UPI00364AB228